SLNGEGEYWCSDIRDRFDAAGLPDVLLYVGGNIIVGHRPGDEIRALFRSFGFDRVYHQQPDIGIAIADLDQDLNHGPT
ncbi:MAG: methylaspartate mutase subunit S, partial [Pseudomonadota bacterium]